MIEIRCPFCSNIESSVIDKRNSRDFESIRRRRECSKCSKRWTTFESIGELSFYIVKRNGKLEHFNREKLFNSVLKASNKIIVDTNKIESIVDSITNELRSNDTKQVHSSVLGSMVLDRLKNIDKLSYLRFLSVHKNLDFDRFKKEVKNLG